MVTPMSYAQSKSEYRQNTTTAFRSGAHKVPQKLKETIAHHIGRFDFSLDVAHCLLALKQGDRQAAASYLERGLATSAPEIAGLYLCAAGEDSEKAQNFRHNHPQQFQKAIRLLRPWKNIVADMRGDNEYLKQKLGHATYDPRLSYRAVGRAF